MRFVYSVILLLLCSISVFAQKTAPKQPRILILLDESSSMVEKWSPAKARYQVAHDVILSLMDSIYKVNDQVEFSLRVFGHQSPVPDKNCFDTRSEVAFSKSNYTQMSLRLASIMPNGVTPIAYALQEAAENDLPDEARNAYSIILITDGGESCGGNICEVVKRLIDKKVYFRPYIVSLLDYAPLRTEYACLGEYLQVVKETDVPVAVGKIVSFYKPMITLAPADNKLTTTLAHPPSAQKVTMPQVSMPKPVEDKPLPKEDVATLKPARQPAITTPKPETVVEKPVSHIKVNDPEPLRPEREEVATLKPAKQPAITTPKPETVVEKPVSGIPLNNPEPLRPEREEVTRLSVRATSLPLESKAIAVLKKIKTPAVPNPKPLQEVAAEAPKPPVSKPVVKNTKPPKQENTTEMNLKTVNIPADESSLEIYFTDKTGEKYYHTTPEISLTDPATGAEVSRFYRFVDAAGNPDPVKNIPPGTYNINIIGKTSYIRGRQPITIEKNKRIKATMQVEEGSLHFEYEKNTNRPVSEFNATVILRSDRGNPFVKQKCSIDLPYEPGNYHLEINTLPTTVRNVDIDFGSTSVIYIAEPGFLQFTNANKMGKVSLYCPVGDKFLRFYGLNVNGDLPKQKLMLQPGVYQVRYLKDPSIPYAQETILVFNIKSNETLEIELK